MEKVSVVIPVYNNESTISQSIESVINQTYRDWELIIVDDGSMDNSMEICLEYQKKDERIRVIKGEHKGVSAARNRGIKEARYDLIAFNDADDLWRNDKLDKQMKKMSEDNYGLVYCRYEYVTSTIKKYVPSMDCTKKDLEGDIFESLWDYNKIGTPTILLRKQVLDKIGMFNENLQSLEDWEFVMRVSKWFKIGFVGESLLFADYKNDAGVNSKWKDQIATITYIIDSYPEMNRLGKLEYIFSNLRKLKYKNQEELVDQFKLNKYINGYEKQLLFNLNRMLRKEERRNKFYSNMLEEDKLFNYINKYISDKKATIGIYGAGEPGLLLGKLLRKNGYNIYSFFDRNVYEVKGFKCTHPKDNTEKIDLLINTVESVDIGKLMVSDCAQKINIFL